MFKSLCNFVKSFVSEKVSLEKVILSARMISPKEDWGRVNELLAKSDKFIKETCYLPNSSQISILKSFVNSGISIGEMIAYFDKENVKKNTKTNCYYYSGNLILKCAVNPSGDCQDCQFFRTH